MNNSIDEQYSKYIDAYAETNSIAELNSMISKLKLLAKFSEEDKFVQNLGRFSDALWGAKYYFELIQGNYYEASNMCVSAFAELTIPGLNLISIAKDAGILLSKYVQQISYNYRVKNYLLQLVDCMELGIDPYIDLSIVCDTPDVIITSTDEDYIKLQLQKQAEFIFAVKAWGLFC